MILRNYYNILVGMICANRTGLNTATDSIGPGSLMVGRYTDGYKLGWPNHGNGINSISLLNITGVNDKGLIFGTGTSPVTFNDQKLESIYENITAANYNYVDPVYNDATGKFEVQFSCVVSNKGASEVTLTEVGIVKPNVSYSYNGNSGNSNYVLVYREVLKTPITIGSGENVQYTQKFEIAIPEIS